MFVLYPDGSAGGSGVGGSGSDQFRQKLWFFGKLGLYFGVLHAISYYMNPSQASSGTTKSIQGSK